MPASSSETSLIGSAKDTVRARSGSKPFPSTDSWSKSRHSSRVSALVVEKWSPVLRSNGMGRFDEIWQLDTDWLEPINQRRGGWSGVSRIRIIDAGGAARGLFIKRQSDSPSLALRRTVAAGVLVRRLHDLHLQHHALKPDNFFLRIPGPGAEPELCFLDLEMMRWHPWPALRDLVTLAHKSAGWSTGDRMRFFLSYRGEARLTPPGKRLWRRLARRHEQKYGSSKP
jgi:hypothetical protein